MSVTDGSCRGNEN
uniref:Uncharacterized protein n=1 Tax=Arundo donax TaxID=35708 RepID=A0A0A8ZRW4_ARUDO